MLNMQNEIKNLKAEIITLKTGKQQRKLILWEQ